MVENKVGERKEKTAAVITGTVILLSAFLYCAIYGAAHKKEDPPQDMTAVPEETVYEEIPDSSMADRFYKDIVILSGVGQKKQRIKVYLQDESCGYVFLPAYADLKQLSFQYDALKYRVNLDGEAYGSEMPLPEIIAEKPYKLTYQNLEKQEEEQSLELIFMKSDNIPAIFISTQSGSMEWLHLDRENKESGEIFCISEEGMAAYAGVLEKITGRGNSSWLEDKKSYSITLQKEAGLAGMAPAKTWVLQANALDATRMRNKLTYDIARAAGLQYAIDSAYTDVWLNGEYAGNYLLCEKIEAGEDRVNISAEDIAEQNSCDYIRPGTEEGAWWNYSAKTDVRHGYLLEFNERIGEDEAGFFRANGRQVEIRNPKKCTYEEYEYIRGYVEEMTECLEKAAWSDEYLEYIDLESWSLVYVINELTNDTDANRYSVFYYKDKGTKLYAGPIWDYDIAWGNEFLGKDVRCSFFRNGWYGTLYDNDIFYQSLKKNYAECMKPAIEAQLSEGIDALCGKIRSSIRMDEIRWQHSDGYTRRSGERDWEQATVCLKDYMQERMEYFDDVWLSGETYFRIFFVNGDMVVAVTYIRQGDQIPDDTLAYVAECLGADSWRDENGTFYNTSYGVEADMFLYAHTVQDAEE